MMLRKRDLQTKPLQNLRVATMRRLCREVISDIGLVVSAKKVDAEFGNEFNNVKEIGTRYSKLKAVFGYLT
jgi:hypothetical protein